MKFTFPLVLFLFCFFSSNAQWNDDSSTRNPICTSAGFQGNQNICTDGNQGAYIFWNDYRNDINEVIYGQRIDSGGYLKWKINGVGYSDSSQSTQEPFIVPDKNKGVYLAYQYSGNLGEGNIELNRINNEGVSEWGGPKEIDMYGDGDYPGLRADGHGGAIVDYINFFESSGGVLLTSIYMQWVDSNGRSHFPDKGLLITTNNNGNCTLVTDNNFNAYLLTPSGDSMKLLKVDSGGKFVWGQNGITLPAKYSFYTISDLIPDNNGGCIISWLNSDSNDNIYAQRIDKDGNLLWKTPGILVDSSLLGSGNQIFSFSCTNDGKNGAYFIYGNVTQIQHVNGNGKVTWKEAKPLSSTLLNANGPYAIPDGDGGIDVTWNDLTKISSVYAQRIDSNGNYKWQSKGVLVFTGDTFQVANDQPLISLNDGSAIAALIVTKVPSHDIYAARFSGSPSTGINIVKTNAGLSIYPNPNSGVFYLRNNSSVSSVASLQIFNSMGKLVNEQKINLSSRMQQRINLSNSAKGIYFIKILSATGTESNFSAVIQ